MVCGFGRHPPPIPCFTGMQSRIFRHFLPLYTENFISIVLFLIRPVRPPRYLKIAPNPDQWVPPTSKHGPTTNPETPMLEQVPAQNTSYPLLPPCCPIISTSKIFKIIPKGCERSQTEEGCLLNAFSEFFTPQRVVKRQKEK